MNTAPNTDPSTIPTRYTGTPRFTLTHASLSAALKTVALAVDHSSLPVLQGVLLEGNTDRTLTLSAFNFETAVSVRIPDAAPSPGRVLIKHQELLDLIAALVKGTRKAEADRIPATITAHGGTPTLQLAGATMPLTAFDIANYPCPPAAPEPLARVNRQTFEVEATRVLRTVGDDDAIPWMTTVHLHGAVPGLFLTGTDRYRLAFAYITPDLDAHTDQSPLRRSTRSPRESRTASASTHSSCATHWKASRPQP